MARLLYVDVDGTLVSPGGDLFWEGSTALIDSLLAASASGIDVVPVTGRGRVQVRELCRLLALSRGIAELGCIHLEGNEARYELGAFPFVGETPVEAFVTRGPLDLVRANADLESHDPWNEGREATYILRGQADVDAVNTTLAEHGYEWCELVDNGALSRRPGSHAYHLAPVGTGKVAGVAVDRERHAVDKADAFYIGDSAADLACAAEVAECWLVANADAGLEWPLRTSAPYGAGVSELITRLLAS